MAGNSFGNLFRITTWGESHGKALGVVVDGVPAGLELCESDVQAFLDRRKPGQSHITTQRKEADQVEILSGLFESRTTGTPISMLIKNTAQISSDYTDIASYYRPGHADYLSTLGISLCAYTKSIGPVSIDYERFDADNILKLPTAMPDSVANQQAIAFLEETKEKQDSVGGVIECKVSGLMPGIGDPVFEKLDANLSKAVMSIGAVKAVEIGDGFKVSTYYGSENNDGFCMVDDTISKNTNHSGGVLGGISDGDALVVRAHVKPTPSIYSTQRTVNQGGDEIEINIKGRHDPIIVPSAVVVVESLVAITVLDALLMNMSARLDNIIDFYKT